MSLRNDSRNVFDAVKSRYRALRLASVAIVSFGALLAAYVGVEWFFRQTSHEVIAVVSAALILLGIQLFILTSLTNMLILLYEEQMTRLRRSRDGS